MSWFGKWDGFDEEMQNAPDIFARKPQTNYDRIISKTPEELSDFLCNIASLEDCTSKCPGWAFCRTGHTGILGWLQQEGE